MPLSYQVQSPVVGLVLPSNSPGVHTLWLPIIPLQVGLVLKPGPQEPWTPYRMTQAFIQAGVPKQAIAIGLSEARQSGAKIPKKGAKKSTAKSKSTTKKSFGRKSRSKKSARR